MAGSVLRDSVLIPSLLLVAIPLAFALAWIWAFDVSGFERAGHFYLIAFLFQFAFIIFYHYRYGAPIGSSDAGIKRFMEAPSRILINLNKVLDVILYAEIAVLIIITVYMYSMIGEVVKTQSVLVWGRGLPVEFVLISGIYSIIVYRRQVGYNRSDFQFILAQKCMIDAKIKDDQAEKISHLIDGLSSYNKYLKRRFDLQFDEARVASTIISSSDKNQKMEKVEESFNEALDKLKPASCLSTYAKLESNEQFLVHKRVSTRIIEFGTFLVAIIPVVITVIQFVFSQ